MELDKYIKIKAIHRSWDFDAATGDWNLQDTEIGLRPCTD